MEKTRPVILIVIPNFGYGGAQKVFEQLVKVLNTNYQVIKVVFNTDYNEVYPSKGATYSLNVDASTNLLFKTINFLKRCWRLYLLKNQHKPLATISFLDGANYINSFSFGQGQKILYVHGSKTAYDTNRTGLVRFIENRAVIPLSYLLADSIVTVSAEMAYELTELFNTNKKKIHTINNGIDLAKISLLKNENLSQDELYMFRHQTIVFSGRLAPQKNPLAVIEIFNLIKDISNVNLLIIGDGELKNSMIRTCVSYNINYQIGSDSPKAKNVRVYFLDFSLNHFKYLGRGDLYISTSNFEGFPLSLCEALALEIPILSTDCPTGCREIISPATSPRHNSSLSIAERAEYGTLLPLVNSNTNAKIWSDEIIHLLSNKEYLTFLAENSKIRAKELSLDEFALKWNQLLLNLFNPVR